MKSCLLLFLALPLFKADHYFKNVDGYIVSLVGDTTAVKIKLPGLLGYNINKQVQLIDSTGEPQTVQPAEIKCFGYTNNEKQRMYYSKPIKEGKIYFLEPVVMGPKTCLYQYTTEVGAGFDRTATQEHYTFEKPGGSYMFMTNFAMENVFRQKLKDFYQEYPGMQQLIDTKFQKRRAIQRDIKAILQEVNKLP